MFRFILRTLLLGVMIAACNPKPVPAYIEEWAGQSRPHFPVTTSGDTIPTGVPIPAKGKWINPDSVTKPQTISFRGKTKVAPVQTNIHPAGTPKVVPIPQELT